MWRCGDVVMSRCDDHRHRPASLQCCFLRRRGARWRQVHQIVVAAAVDPHADVIAALQQLPPARCRWRHATCPAQIGTRLRVLHLFGRDDADDFAALDRAALDELDPAVHIWQLTGNSRLCRLGREADGVAAARERLAIGHHRSGNRHRAKRGLGGWHCRSAVCCASALPAAHRSACPPTTPTSHLCFIRVLLRREETALGRLWQPL